MTMRKLVLGAVVIVVTLLAWSVVTAQAVDPTVPTTQPAGTLTLAVLWGWIVANWQTVLLVYLVPCLLAGLRNRTPGTGVLGFIEAALQWVSVLTPKDSPNTLKLPFTAPKAPGA